MGVMVCAVSQPPKVPQASEDVQQRHLEGFAEGRTQQRLHRLSYTPHADALDPAHAPRGFLPWTVAMRGDGTR